jgi:uncharacterized protein YcfJ
VGKTASNVATAGHELLDYGRAIHTVNASTVQILNRNSNDGDMALFMRQGAAVGSIGAFGGYIYTGSGDTNIRFHAGVDAILPANAGGASRSAAIDLGVPAALFKDLYLSGSVYADLIRHKDDTDTYIQWPGNNQLAFNTGGTERMRISGGNVLVGKSAIDSGAVGFQVDGSSGKIAATVSGAEAARFVRTTNDGEIVRLVKDTTTVGSLGTNLGGLYIADAGVGFRFDSGGTDDIIPCNATGGAADASINLGSSGARFKDAYLSGGIYLGGTGAANKLDDYEEGTWTPADVTFSTWTSPTFTAVYTKIGRAVTINLRQTGGTIAASTVGRSLNGLPFSAGAFAVGSVSDGSVNNYGNCIVSGTAIYFTDIIPSETDLGVTVTYYTA